MAASTNRISELIVEQLGRGEKRILSLVVAVRNGLDGNERIRGDLTEMVKSQLCKLVASQAVVDDDGTYSLALLT